MHAEVAWVLVSSRAQVQLQIIPDLDYLWDYLSVSCACDCTNNNMTAKYIVLSNITSAVSDNILCICIQAPLDIIIIYSSSS